MEGSKWQKQKEQKGKQAVELEKAQEIIEKKIIK